MRDEKAAEVDSPPRARVAGDETHMVRDGDCVCRCVPRDVDDTVSGRRAAEVRPEVVDFLHAVLSQNASGRQEREGARERGVQHQRHATPATRAQAVDEHVQDICAHASEIYIGALE